MPHEQLTERQVAAYLSMHLKDVIKLASRQKIPARKVGDEKFLFRKSQVDHWVWEQMHNFDRNQLEGIERGVFAHHGLDAKSPIVCPLIPEAGLVVPLASKTRKAVLRDLVEVANSCDLVYDKALVLEELTGREKLCSTAMLPGVALPHPRHPLEYDIAESFVIAGVSPAGIPFGSEDGSLTRLFFLICCKEDRTHLHVLARLVRMLDDPAVVENLIACESPVDFADALASREYQVIEKD